MSGYQFLKSEKIYQGRAFDVEAHTFRLPNGRQQTYDLVSHRGSVTVVPLDPQGRILFVRQYRLGSASELLELPAGLNDGEDPADCAAREIREETGMAAGKLLELGSFYLAPGYSSEFMHIFLALDLYPAPLQADEDEFLQVSAIPADEAYAMARRGEIHDGKTLAALLLAEKHLLG
jgi:ADP-ribose pyrophosphatase